jgi:hypothetical protein
MQFISLKDLKQLFCCLGEYITTPIKFKLNGKCTNANLVTVIQDKNVKEQFVLYKGVKTKLTQIGPFEDGYCTCCDEVIVTPGGSSGSGSGGAGIGGGLAKAWANAKLFNTQSNNQFFCGGTFGQLKFTVFQGQVYFEFTETGITGGQGSITFYDQANTVLAQNPYITFGTTLISGNYPFPVSVNAISKVVISAGTYSTPNNTLCTGGSITLTQ